jgi:hypothetical protein
MTLLKEVFPSARFLHIIRDPRDCCLSAKKVWGKNLYRTANFWRRTLEVARATGRSLGQDYMEVFYEDLLYDPLRIVSGICDFIGCEFTPEMTELKKPSENLGETKGEARIVPENIKKYVKELPPSKIKRIEEIVFPIMSSLPYEMEYAVEFKPLSPLMSNILLLFDGLAIIRFHVYERGLILGISYLYQLLKESRFYSRISMKNKYVSDKL